MSEDIRKEAAELIERYANAEPLFDWATAALSLLIKIRGLVEPIPTIVVSEGERTSRKY